MSTALNVVTNYILHTDEAQRIRDQRLALAVETPIHQFDAVR